jgi:NADH dehydrogenase [ubiquinone] 1 alpha subcomplex assembly factor 6
MKVENGLVTSRWLHVGVLSKLKARPAGCLRRVSTTASLGPSDPHAYCREFVRKRDYDSFLNSYFYPRHAQNGYFAIKAFSVCGNLDQVLLPRLIQSSKQVELAMVQDNVSNAMIGKMRMQFWRDAVKGISDVRVSTISLFSLLKTHCIFHPG